MNDRINATVARQDIVTESRDVIDIEQVDDSRLARHGRCRGLG
jgi:hypothetical protein